MKTDWNLKLRVQASSLIDTDCCLLSFPPDPDFPIVKAKDGEVISRYKDPIWNLSAAAKRSCNLNFGDGASLTRSKRTGAELDERNAALLRIAMAYLMYGERPPAKPSTVMAMFKSLKAIFKLCHQNKIAASDLSKFPLIIAMLPGVIKSRKSHTLVILHELYNVRDVIGFTILNTTDIQKTAEATPSQDVKQTPYIPKRIWLYQVGRLRAMLEDYVAHQDKIEEFFEYCFDAYLENYESIETLFGFNRKRNLSPFSKDTIPVRGARYHGTFTEIAQKFGISELISRWTRPIGEELGTHLNQGANYFSMYLSAASYVSLLYIGNFSGMRATELSLLRTDCLETEDDARLGKIFLIRGETSKTLDDDRALWITSPKVQLAVRVASSVSRLRAKMAATNPRLAVPPEDIANPYLDLRAYEPWSMKEHQEALPAIRTNFSYKDWRSICNQLFDPRIIAITEEDLAIARHVTPSLDIEKFAVGTEWPFALHQLRRTLTVNAANSGVSDEAIQYELHHQSKSMSLYYAQGYSRLPLNNGIKAEFVGAIYHALAVKASSLADPDFISPLGQKQKEKIVQFICDKDISDLKKLARKGLLSIRETLLGVCLNRDYCEFGGIDYVAQCVRCSEALGDKRKRPGLKELQTTVQDQIDAATPGTPLHEALAAQLLGIEEALNVIAD
ncbi:hypothetical protein R75461_04988 [Paraburkholderia nemoris]|uniref:hypothetical protein n=1 Tax=Paraburkholderia nemoris TaxID=2793076 RepID=UPI00190AE5A5|nr:MULTISPECIES: hypothetical protein [Paraburkholderia]MBK3780770.1 hypothetical protein [Paraburkholderia aspalathi]CAE6796757.1 hypothetical protein R75461_04988 [Paraburkholderia nemoris]